MRSPMLAFAVLLALSTGCVDAREGAGDGPRPHEGLMSTLWTLHSAEYDGLTRTVFAAAERALEAAIADPSLVGAIEQLGADVSALPPAVILDVDETVLDNAAYQAQLILEDGYYNNESWTAWCEKRSATPVPGSLEFIQRAEELGVAVMYVTNRRAHLEESTFDNLKALGYPVTMETLMMRGETDEWNTSNKTPRREHVARTHRIVMMFGDNLGDFLNIEDLDVAARDALIAEHAEWWGSRWFLFPNPMYGSWEAALIDGKYGESSEWKAEKKWGWLQH